MSNDKMKAEFAAWYLATMVEMFGEGTRRQVESNLAWVRDDGSYVDPTLRMGLMAWEGSRAAVMVELPIRNGKDRPGSIELAIDECRFAIEVEGVKCR